jgi:hypothetical protein
MANIERSAREQLEEVLGLVAECDAGTPYIPRSYDERSALEACRESGLAVKVVVPDANAPEGAHYAGAWGWLLSVRGREWLDSPPIPYPERKTEPVTAEVSAAREATLERAREIASE